MWYIRKGIRGSNPLVSAKRTKYRIDPVTNIGMETTHIIFDLGNVVLTNDWHYDCPEKFEAYASLFDITYDEMERGWNATWPLFRIGKISEEEFWDKFLRAAGAKVIDINKAKELWREYQQPIETMLGLLQKLKHFYHLSAITTISKEWLTYKTDKYQLDKLFDVIISSGNSGLVKPDPAIYKLLFDALKVSPVNCLFIDDNADCLIPAKNMGMQVLQFNSQGKLEEQLCELGIRF